MKRIVLNLVLISVFLALVSCKEYELVHGLNERDASEIIVLLAKNNISAEKKKEERNQEIFWTITVDTEDQIQAQGILVANHLPREQHGGLKGICDEPGMIVTEKFEKCQEILALKGEIINALESIPGVVKADAVLNIPEKEEFPSEDYQFSRPTVAVTLEYLNDANVKTDLTEGKVQEFVANTVEGLDARDVKVIISYVEQKLERPVGPGSPDVPDGQASLPGSQTTSEAVPATQDKDMVSMGGILMDADSAKKFKLISVIFLVLLLLLAVAFIFALVRISRLRKQGAVALGAVTEKEKGGDSKKLLEV